MHQDEVTQQVESCQRAATATLAAAIAMAFAALTFLLRPLLTGDWSQNQAAITGTTGFGIFFLMISHRYTQQARALGQLALQKQESAKVERR